MSRHFKTIDYFYFSVTAYIFGKLLNAALYMIFNDLFPFSINYGIYIINNIVYHLAEFLFVCHCHYEDLSWNSFLINHSDQYTIAFFSANLEYLIKPFLIGRDTLNDQLSYALVVIGSLLCILGQAFRIGAFISAQRNFNHQVQTHRDEKHVLVTSGLYRFSRHPSYFGFFWYSLGCQILLLNPLCLVAYTIVLWRFFLARLKTEEIYLIKFFGEDYLKFQKSTPTRIPLIDSHLANFLQFD